MNNVVFTEKEFDVLRKFQNKMNAVFGESAYVGADNAVVLLEYSPTLKAMLRPFPSDERYDFQVKILSCKDCKKTALFLCLPEEETYVCNDCLGRRKKNG
jgi:hypothetical protein